MGLFKRALKKKGEAVQERYLAPFQPLLREGEEIIQVAVARDPYGDPNEMIYVGPTNQRRVLYYYGRERPSAVSEINLGFLSAAGMSYRDRWLVRLVEAPMFSSQLSQRGGGYTDTMWELLPNQFGLQVMEAIVEQIGGPDKMNELETNLEQYVRERGL